MKVNLNTESIRLISLFQEVTGAHVLDSYENEELYFVVSEGEYGLAVGKNGMKIKRVENILRKQVKVYEYSPDFETFVKNLIPHVKEISNQEGKVEVKVAANDRSKVIGKAGYRAKIIEHFIKRFFSDVESFKVK